MTLGPAHLSGKIDLLRIDAANKTITIVDYKTGRLGNDPAKLYRYELQLYCYKFLVAGSHSFRDYTVTNGQLVFVEPNERGKIHVHDVIFDDAVQQRIGNLIRAMWQCIQTLQLPDTSAYTSSISGIKKFEQDLIDSLQ